MIVPIAGGVLVFVSLMGVAVAVLAPVRVGRSSVERRMQGLASPEEEQRRTASPSLRRLRAHATGRVLNDSRWARAAAAQLRRANVPMRVAEYLLARLLLAAVLFTISVFAMRGHPASLAVAGAAGVVGYLLPALYVRAAARRRGARIEKQLIEFLPGLAAALRSGFSLQQAIAAAAEQTGPPLAQELAIVVHDIGLGATTDAALLELDRRVGSTDLGMVVTAVLVHRTTGGSLAELLDQAAETLRERERVRGDVMTFTAQQRLTGLVLSIYPIAVGLVLLALAPSLWSKLFTETVGQVQLGIAVGLQVLGFLAMRRALDIKV